MKKIVIIVLLAAASFVSADNIRGINIDFVTIGHAGNAADTITQDWGEPLHCGAVGYNYRIGKYEVTNAQWNAFIAAASAPTGNDGGYGYSAYWAGAQQPTNWVSWYEAAQFCNYLTSGNKLQGAYQFSNGYFQGVNRVAAQNAYGTIYVIPTEDEWYKAAYFKPDASGYSLYANGTNVAPVAGVDTNYYNVIGSPWNITNGTMEQNGTFNMMGNVWEWNETLLYGSYRGLRGGSYYYTGDDLGSSYRSSYPPCYDRSYFGFRVAEIPEPATLSLLALGGLFLRRKK